MMTIHDLLTEGGGALLVLTSLLQISPIPINPWTAAARALGRAINGELYKKLDSVASLLDAHISQDEADAADRKRSRILHFNGEILRRIDHTEEEFIDVLKDIDDYRSYCKTHKDYQNSRAVHTIANIERVYDERLLKNDFL